MSRDSTIRGRDGGGAAAAAARLRRHQGRGVAALVFGLSVVTWAPAPAAGTPPASPRVSRTLWSQDRGILFGAQLVTNVIDAAGPGPDSGPDDVFVEDVGRGIALFAGYAFTSGFDLRATLDAEAHGANRADVSLLHSSLVIEARYRFLPYRQLHPYVLGGLGGTGLRLSGNDFEIDITGSTAVMGAGLLAQLTHFLALDVSARLDLINWDQFDLQVALPDGSRLQLGEAVEGRGHATKVALGVSAHL